MSPSLTQPDRSIGQGARMPQGDRKLQEILRRELPAHMRAGYNSSLSVNCTGRETLLAFESLPAACNSLQPTNPRELRQAHNQTATKCIFRWSWDKMRARVAYTYRRPPKSKSSGNENGVGFMHCTSCQSANLAEFTAEMMIHFSGPRNIDHPGIPAFPKVLVCLNCGSSQFTVPATTLTILASRTAANDRQVPLGGRLQNPLLRVA